MTIGLIGCGKMGSALTLGAIKKGVFESHQVLAYDPVPEAIAALGNGISAAKSLEEAIHESDILLLCVKPYQVSEVLAKIPPLVQSSNNLLVISIAAGVKIETMEESCNHQARIVRAMPNTPALVGEGAAAFALGKKATDADADFTEKLFGSIGIVYEVKESLLDTVTGLSGSGPAYVYTFIEALADGALLEGLPAIRHSLWQPRLFLERHAWWRIPANTPAFFVIVSLRPAARPSQGSRHLKRVPFGLQQLTP